jgi:teichuronic acid biosynthesis glycosyltransferase TuaG
MQKEMKHQPLISIIIPCFNASPFIAQTINSVLSQTYSNFEIICINDGSTDNSEFIIKNINDKRLNYYLKNNTGVSDTRNQGLHKAKGEFVLFLDADDILSDQYIEKSIHSLQQNSTYGFCTSTVFKINEQGKEITKKTWKGASSDILREVLSYSSEIITCPSNYVFRTKILVDNSVSFNTKLSSSADRYFLVEVSNFTKGILITADSYLYYRVHPKSMSNNFTPSLLRDNILFQKKVNKIESIPKKLKEEFNFKTNYIFAGSSFRLNQFIPCFFYSLKALYYNPFLFIKQLFIKA